MKVMFDSNAEVSVGVDNGHTRYFREVVTLDYKVRWYSIRHYSAMVQSSRDLSLDLDVLLDFDNQISWSVRAEIRNSLNKNSV